MEIKPFEKVISESLKTSKLISTKDLGGIDYLFANIEAVTSSSFLPEILKSISNELEQIKEPERSQCESILLASLRCCNNAFSIREVIHIVETEASPILSAKDTTFLIYLEECQNTHRVSFVRSWLLEAAFRSSLIDKSRRFKLLSYLIDISLDNDQEYLRHVSKILGLCYSSWQEDELIKKLIEIRDIHHVVDEAWFELGMCYLLKALNSETNEVAISNFVLAKEHLRKAIELNSERPDAEAYVACISILLSLSSLQNQIDKGYELDKITQAITIYSAWHISENDSIWMSARNTELANWYVLIDKLFALFSQFDEPSWFEPKTVIETSLLKIYSASRSILKRTKSGGLEKIIQPNIEAVLIRKKDKLYLLDRWFETSNDKDLHPIAKELKENFERHKRSLDEKEEQTFSETFREIEKSPKYPLNKLDQFFADCNSTSQTEVNPVIESLIENITESLATIESYKIEKVRSKFNILLNQTLKFLESRMNMTLKDSKRMEYLYEQEKRPLEASLQEDYFQYIHGNISNASTTVEKNNISGGRVDVNISFGQINFSAEIKRDWENCSFEAIRTKYLGQAAEYSNTDVKLGFLLVLDLTPKPNGVNSIESSVKVEIVDKENDPIKRAIVVILVPGMRNTPSNVKARA